MKKTGLFLSTILLLIVLTIGLMLSASAEDVIESGTWGDLSWSLNKTTGELTISGEGTMDDFDDFDYFYFPTVAWHEYDDWIKTATIEQGVTSIGSWAFAELLELESVTIPDSVTSIGDKAFYRCQSLTSITIPNGVTSIDSYAFSHCAGLATITIPDSVTSIGSYAFFGCRSLESITISNSVTSIGNGAFSDCMSLTNITIPDNVTSINGSTFSNCASLTNITIPDSVTSIGMEAFYGCESLPSITLPDGVTSIGSYAFYGCTSLESITIPKNVINIASNAFYQCTSLISITVQKENPKYHAAGNCFIETESKTLLFGCKNSVIPADGSVTSIGGYAFYGCTSLESITIPNSVTRIGNGAFDQCSSLVSVTLPDSITLISESLFSGCTSLESITIPDSVTRIGSYAFSNCKSLERVTLPNRIANVDSHAFLYCTNLKEIALSFYPYHIQSISSKAFQGCTNISTVIFCGTERQLNTITFNESLKMIAKYHDLRCETLNGREHKEICAYCDHEVIQEHAWQLQGTDSEPTHLTEGKEEYFCPDCQSTKYETIEKLTEHTFGSWQPHDAMQHKRECACGEVEYEHHVYTDDQALTCTICHEERVLEEVTTPVEAPSQTTEAPAAYGCGASVSGGLGLLLICLSAAVGMSLKKKES